MNRSQAIEFMLQRPSDLGRLLGFNKLTGLHNEWIRSMVLGKEDETLQSHRGSYKTTCVSIALAEILTLFPNEHTMFLRKTDTDTKEIVSQVKKLILSPEYQYLVKCIYGTKLTLVTSTQSEIVTNLYTGTSGTSQLYASGIGGSLTGKHFDRIFTDDIVNLEDRVSKAEREKTKMAYQELQNIRNRGGRIYNTGTPWHKDDCFQLMPNIKRFDCYTTGLIDDATLSTIRESMTSSLFSANYELKHVADEEMLFPNPKFSDDVSKIYEGIAHIDASYGGADSTAFTIIKKVKETDPDGSKHERFYVFGKLMHKHIDDCEEELIHYRKKYYAGKIYCENNGDKGYLAKDLRKKGERVVSYHEDMNKYLKITSYLKAMWKDVVFVAGTDEAYINQICDYNENAEHDDAPDSLASSIRLLWKKRENTYQPIIMG